MEGKDFRLNEKCVTECTDRMKDMLQNNQSEWKYAIEQADWKKGMI